MVHPIVCRMGLAYNLGEPPWGDEFKVTMEDVLEGYRHANVSTPDERMEAFDYTCRYYLKMPGLEFLRLYELGKVQVDNPSTPLLRVLAMLPMVR
jgi:hypothetical protein